MTDLATCSVEAVPVDGPVATGLLRAYFTDIIGRYHGRPATEAEVDAALAGDPNDGLVPPTGLFLVLRGAAGVAGCVGVRLLDVRTAELKRMYVVPAARGRGLGRLLIAAAEAWARDLGADEIRLDTRADLVEARGLYAVCGFVEIPPYNDNPYAQHWFAKDLRADTAWGGTE